MNYKESDLTQWHSGKTKPKHIGVYEREDVGGNYYNYWSGKYWCYGHKILEYIVEGLHTGELNKHEEQNKPWRGLRRKP